MMKALVPAFAIALTACSELSTVHYVNNVNAEYNAAATGYRDTDGDGVMDFRDMCPRTQPGLSVAGDGCEALVAVAHVHTELCESLNNSVSMVAVERCDSVNDCAN